MADTTPLDQARVVALIAATLTMAVMAGVFQLYAYAIMPGLRRTDDRTFVAAFQQIDTAIINPWFMFSFFGALLFTAIAAALHFGAPASAGLAWTAVALVLYLAVVIMTLRVNVPRNNQIKAAGDPDRIPNLRAVRDTFDEARWVRWNLVRAVLTTVALACLVWAVVLV